MRRFVASSLLSPSFELIEGTLLDEFVPCGSIDVKFSVSFLSFLRNVQIQVEIL